MPMEMLTKNSQAGALHSAQGLLVLGLGTAFALLLQYRGAGRWRNYLYGERVYMLLSLGAKSALAWQVFAGTLRPV